MSRPAYEPALHSSIAIALSCSALGVLFWNDNAGLVLFENIGAITSILSLWWLGLFRYCAAWMHKISSRRKGLSMVQPDVKVKCDLCGSLRLQLPGW